MTTLDDLIAAAQALADEAGTVINRDDQAGTATLELTSHAEWEALDIDLGSMQTVPRARSRLGAIRAAVAGGIPDAATCTANLDAWAAAQGLTSAQAQRLSTYMFLKAVGGWS